MRVNVENRIDDQTRSDRETGASWPGVLVSSVLLSFPYPTRHSLRSSRHSVVPPGGNEVRRPDEPKDRRDRPSGKRRLTGGHLKSNV